MAGGNLALLRGLKDHEYVVPNESGHSMLPDHTERCAKCGRTISVYFSDNIPRSRFVCVTCADKLVLQGQAQRIAIMQPEDGGVILTRDDIALDSMS